MDKCPTCGKELTEEMICIKMCFQCGSKLEDNSNKLSKNEINMLKEIGKEKEQIEIARKEKELKEKIKQHLLTTGFNFEGYKISEYKGIVSGQVVLGTGFFSEFSAAVNDIFGTESNAMANKVQTAKKAAMNKLIESSIKQGGNAIIGVDFDFVTLINNMIGVFANGTSVFIEKSI